jgi:hypothetical protein
MPSPKQKYQNKKSPVVGIFSWAIVPADKSGEFIKNISIQPQGAITMFLKSKICFTAFTIYEITVISLLHFDYTCYSVFSPGFCLSDFKYFVFAVAVPLVGYLIWMWIHEIVHRRRRRQFISRAKNIVSGIVGNVRDTIAQHMSHEDLERILTAAILVGLKRYVDKHSEVEMSVSTEAVDKTAPAVKKKRQSQAKKTKK